MTYSLMSAIRFTYTEKYIIHIVNNHEMNM